VLLRPDGDDPAIARIAPFTKDQRSVDGRARAFVCRNFVCERPIEDVAALAHALDSTRGETAAPKAREKP
jgi:uncharacterized protein YyaL (SSP411 family)